jgi:hypothetical protein
MLPHLLTEAGKLRALHPKTATLFEPNTIYVAPPDRHMLIMRNYILLSHGPHENLARPAIDPLFGSAAVAYGPAVVGVVLIGRFNYGTTGLLAIKDRGASQSFKIRPRRQRLQYLGVQSRTDILGASTQLAGFVARSGGSSLHCLAQRHWPGHIRHGRNRQSIRSGLVSCLSVPRPTPMTDRSLVDAFRLA